MTVRCHYCGCPQEVARQKCLACGTTLLGYRGQTMTPRPGRRAKPTLDTIELTGAGVGRH